MKTPHDRYDDWIGSLDAWEEDLYGDWDEEEEEERGFSCDQCGPWCPDWGGDGLCMLAIRSMAEEYGHDSDAPSPFYAYRLWRLRAFLSEILSRILPAKCPGCGRFYIFSKGDHGDCLPF
jgi:hypothetical protein